MSVYYFLYTRTFGHLLRYTKLQWTPTHRGLFIYILINSMRSKNIVAIATVIISCATASTSHAQTLLEENAVVDIEANTTVSAPPVHLNNINRVVKQAVTASTTIRGNATSTAAKDDHPSTTRGNGNATSTSAVSKHADYDLASSTSDEHGELTAENHRSTVATFTKSLLSVADREGGIGTEVRTIAQSQNDSATVTATAMAHVEDRGRLFTFFFGSDYKNLGVIRSEVATTTAHIAQLKKLTEKATSDTDRAELTADLEVLQAEQVKMSAYVSEHESVFSLFGWFAKLFAK